jgi:hypothetical protein
MTKPAGQLSLAEKFFLLTIDNDKGIVMPFVSQSLRYGLAGAVLAELSLQGAIRLGDKKLIVAQATSTGVTLLDETLQHILAEKHPRKSTYWVDVLATRKLASQVAQGLEAKKVLRIGEKRYHWAPSAPGAPAASVKYRVKENLRGIVLADGDAGPHERVLLSLLNAGKLLNLVFTRDEQKAAQKQVALMVGGESIGKAVAETIRSIESAAAAAALSATA